MGFLDLLVKPSSPAPVVTPTPVENVTPVAAAVSMAAPCAGTVNEDMLKEIMEAIDAANTPGYDYLELRQSIQNMAAMTMFTDEQKIAAALATVSGQTSVEKILGSIDHYQQIVNNKEAEFQQGFDELEKAEVGEREKTLADIEASIQTKAEQIKTLTAEIGKLQEDKAAISSEKEGKRVKISSAKAAVTVTAEHVRGLLNTDREKIKRAVPSTAVQG